jgi:hypothetical protein
MSFDCYQGIACGFLVVRLLGWISTLIGVSHLESDEGVARREA